MKKLWQTSSALDTAVENYTVGNDPLLDQQLVRYEIYGSLAHAAGLAGIGVLSKKELQALRRAFHLLHEHPDLLKITTAQEDVHTAVEQWLTDKLGEIGAKIHAGRSRNDQVQVDLRLFLKDRLLDLHQDAGRAAQAWLQFGRQHQKQLLPGYSHLQRAMPTTIGHWAASHAEALQDGRRALRFAYDEADACPLGSAAGYGASLPLDRDYVAKLLGFSRVQRNTLRVQSSRPRIEAATLSSLTLLARDLGTLAWDLSLYTSAEFGFLSLDTAFTTGSSLMPQKKNPDVVELTRGRAALFAGWLNQVLALGALPSGYHRDYQLTKAPLLAAIAEMDRMLDIIARLPKALSVNAARCASAVTEDMLATHRALALVREGVPFREAYRRIADKARSMRDPKPAADIPLPDYPGAPGNPDWPALSRELERESAWAKTRQLNLHRRWSGLLSVV